MERRSTRGRTSSISDSPAALNTSTTSSSEDIEMLPVDSLDDSIPEVGGEEVVLNRRGMPARARKKNRLYFDDEVMITDTFNRRGQSKSHSPAKRGIKLEPMDDDSEMITGDIPDYGMAEEVEIPAAVEEEVITTPGPRRPGRPKKSLTGSPMPPPNSAAKRRFEGESPRRGSESPSKTAKILQKSPLSDIARGRGRSETRKSKDSPQRTRLEEAVQRITKTPDRPTAKAGRGSSSKDDNVTRIKKEPGTPTGNQEMMDQRYVEKREKDRIAKERERERKKEKERQMKEREREYNSVLPLKSRGRREPTPTDFSSAILSTTSALDDFKQTIDKKTAQDISLRLRNLLKLPKAHKWVCYEWFYSNIDKVLFEGENDFQTCLRESFPLLKARKLTRVEWCKIRRIMGKPRRCSQAFFDEEREELGRRRQKIRMIQQRKITDFNYKELPDEIPLQLTIGTKVTARLRRPQDGLFTGTIEGVDTSNNTYRITFDRAGLGTHSIPDYEVLSNDPVETVSTSSFALKIPRRSFGFGTAAFKFQNPGLIGEDGLYRFPTSPFPEGGMLGGFPIRLLDMIVRLSKLLKAKREKILQLKELNVEAEKMLSYGKPFNTDYRLRYARCVLDLDSMNKEMAMYVEGIQTYCLEQIAPDHGANQMIVPEQVQDQCKQEATLIVETYNSKNSRRAVQDTKTIGLISNLTSLMLQIKTLSTGERNLYELKSIKDTIKETKASLEGKNLQLFQNRVEIPMNRIQAGLCIYTKSF